MREFICQDCGAVVACAIARVMGDSPERELCFLCLWVREEEPDDLEARRELRALVDRE